MSGDIKYTISSLADLGADMTFSTREEWLIAAAGLMAPRYAETGHPLPPCRMSIGFTSHGKRSKRIGECWAKDASADQTHEIFIRPDIADPVDVLAVLCHELAHAAAGIVRGHKQPFGTIARFFGLDGKLHATTPGEAFKRYCVETLLPALGPLPHARLELASGKSTGPKKQTARLLKAECPLCGYTVRVTRKWVADVGAPHCPRHGAMDIEGIETESPASSGETEES